MKEHRTIVAWLALLVVLLAVGFFCRPAHAASAIQQLSLSVGGQARWLDTPYLNAQPDFEATGNAALTITPHIDVTGGVAAGLKGSYLREQVDVRFATSEGSDTQQFSVWLGGGYYWSEDFDDGLDGWATKAGVAWTPSLNIPANVGVTVAATPEDGRSSISIMGVWLLKKGGE